MKPKNNSNNNIFLGPELSVCLFPPWATANPASLGGPPIPLGRSLDPLWALWGQLRCWCGQTPLCPCPPNPQLLKLDQSQLWEHSSIQPFHRLRVYQANHGDLILSLHSCMERFPFLFLSHTAPGAQFWFWPHLHMWATLRHLFPAQARGVKSSG